MRSAWLSGVRKEAEPRERVSRITSNWAETEHAELQMTSPFAAVSTILPGAPSCAAVKMRSEPLLLSQTPTFDLSFAASQKVRNVPWDTLSFKDSPVATS